jgi:hypothetical protein
MRLVKIENTVNNNITEVNILLESINNTNNYQIKDTNIYLDSLKHLIYMFDEQYKYRLNLYKNTPLLEKKLKSIVTDNLFSEYNEQNNLADIKREIDTIFYKYMPLPSEQVNENTDGLDLELMDKITPLVPEGKEVLLKNIVKEINGSAKGLSDYVIMFTKYRQSIINHNGIEYFQRKGCHFLRKI